MARAQLIAAALIALTLTGCHPARPAPVAPLAGRLRVGATPFALAEVARRVGLGRVVVSDHGDVTLPPASGAWLDPVAMQAVTRQVADTLSARDPAGRGAYRAAARAYQAQLGALDIDYRSSLADCARHDIVTADGAFVPVAHRYNFVDHIAGAGGAAGEPGLAETVRARGIPVLFTETGTSAGAVLALAAATHTRVDQLDSATVLTADETARGATYLSLMADNLAKLRTALACTAPA